MAEVERIA
ncbi:hypothetical protein D037_0061A, partial [Vibrio parahaemolyticus IDH02640]